MSGSSAEKDAGQPRLFDVPAETVVGSVGCVWCCVEIGQPCREKGRRMVIPHAQRWYEYHNATHDRRDHIPVYTAYGMRANRAATTVLPPADGAAS